MKTFAWLLAATLGMTALPAGAETLRACTVAAAEGEPAMLIRAGRRETVTVGLAIADSDRILTRPGARLFIRCSDGATVTIGPGTDINLGTLLGPSAEDGYFSRVLRGLAGFVLPNPGPENFEVRTPSAVASVRSTEWTVDVAPNSTAVFVREGLVLVRAQGGTGVLRAGDGVDVQSGGGEMTRGLGFGSSALGRIGTVKRWGAVRVDAMQQRLGFGWE